MYTDDKLMALLSSQNQTDINHATTCLYQRYFSAILWLVRGNQWLRLDEKSFATDIFFEAVKGIIKRTQTGEDMDNFGAYFRRIFKNKFIDAVEKEKNRIARFVEEGSTDKKDDTEPSDYDVQKTENAFVNALLKAFNALDVKDRQILCLRHYAGLKLVEIFEQGLLFDMTYVNIRQRYDRACERLRKNLVHFNMHQLSDTSPINMKNLCQHYQN